ncbi:Gfo/Idh/MocA family oxidoreductase [Paenibacillus sp. P25]|nr:Gfo/Idh/MocA family oxidoreductase [Paenibacillus sp. P25]
MPDSHAAVTTAALELGCDVFGEKPMSTSMAEAHRLVELAGKRGRTYAVMQNRRYLPQIRAFRDLVVSGAIGQVGFVNADFFLGPHFGGFRDAMESPSLLDMAIHTFDQARLITGKDPVSVYCHEFNPPGSWYAGNASAVCIFEYEDGGVFCYRGSWCSEGSPTSWEADWRISGSKGTARWDGTTAPYAEVTEPSAEPSFMSRFRRIEAEVNWPGQSGHAGHAWTKCSPPFAKGESRKRTARTISRVWRWCTARWRAQQADGRSGCKRGRTVRLGRDKGDALRRHAGQGGMHGAGERPLFG